MTTEPAHASVRIGVVTICWNNLEGLKSTVESVDHQTTPPSRMVIVDGDSTDGTKEWLSSTELPEFAVSFSEPDRGIYDAMNKGMNALLDLDLVMFMNSGDRYADPHQLQVIAEDYAKRRWSWAYGDAAMGDGEGDVEWIHTLRHLGRIRFMCGLGSVPHQAAAFSSGLLRTVGSFRLDLPVVADQEYIYRCWQVAPPALLPGVVARCDASGVSSELEPGAFAGMVAAMRREAGHDILGSRRIDRWVTRCARTYLRVRLSARERRLAQASQAE